MNDILGGSQVLGLLSPELQAQAEQRARSAGLTNLGFALLQASQGQPGQRRPGLGQIIGQAGPVGLQAYQQSFDRTLQDMLRAQQIQDMQRQRASELRQQQQLETYISGLPPEEQARFRAFPEQAATAMFREQPESFRQLTDAEKTQMGLPANKNFQMSSKSGKVSEIGGGGTSVTVTPGETETQKGYAKFGVERNTAIFSAGQQAVQNIPKIDNTLNLLKEGDPRTGFGSEFLKNIDRVRSAFSGRNIQSISDTELLNSLLGADVFPQIGALGIGARGLDTPAEREFLREVMTGTIAMNKDTLIRLTELRKKYEKKSLDTYNEAVDSGQLDSLFQYSGLPKRKLSIGRNIEVDY